MLTNFAFSGVESFLPKKIYSNIQRNDSSKVFNNVLTKNQSNFRLTTGSSNNNLAISSSHKKLLFKTPNKILKANRSDDNIKALSDYMTSRSIREQPC